MLRFKTLRATGLKDSVSMSTLDTLAGEEKTALEQRRTAMRTVQIGANMRKCRYRQPKENRLVDRLFNEKKVIVLGLSSRIDILPWWDCTGNEMG